ncbi:RICIN domain-containing protein [Actinoallomurus purpureus]|uniref:RICIN domain-containing protein n=1 Tax=Actinoallomurus purpureus TaxID=478114 RepID=UPI002093DAE0|nr:RICIN domain-containing protein [Actinoallomurus purpureus]MCO6003678.1 RICIN domain-containing protein [Actinoallomurus purpureus]
MKIILPRTRLALTAGLAASFLTISGSFTSASAATYWTFKSRQNGRCLTGSTSGKAWVAGCTGGSTQQWDWVGSGSRYNQLKNRATGTCLTTDFKTYNNALWLSTCSSSRPPGQLFGYEDGYIGAWDFSAYRLRTSPSGSDAVYSSDITYAGIADGYYQWAVGTLT